MHWEEILVKKKFMLVLTMFISFTILLSACGAGGDKAAPTEKGSNAGKKTLRVVTDAAFAPFEYMDKGKIAGFDVDLAKAVAKEAGYSVNMENIGWDPMFVELDQKRADFAAAAITINDERKESYEYSTPYFLSTIKILVKKGSNIKSAADLKGKVVAVQNATTGQEAAESVLGKNNPDLRKFESNTMAIQELKSGGADAVVADNTVVEKYAENNPKDKLVVVEDPAAFEAEFYGLLFPKGSALKAELDTALKALMDNGTYGKIYKEWFGTDPDIEKLKAQQ
jgi:ABC-type amino acid transport substrate-binding protein